MKTQILRVLCPLSALAALLYVGDGASAQSASPGSSPSSSGSSIAHHVGKATPAKDVLNSPRLLSRVTIERKTTTVEQALAKLSEFTLMHLEAQGDELRFTRLYFHYNATPLRDILASIAETGYWEWTKKNENTLVLKERYHSHALDLYHPHTEAELEVHERGIKFLDQFGSLPPDMQAALSILPKPTHDSGLAGVPFSKLPSAMQDNLRAMFAAFISTLAPSGAHPHMTSADLAHSTVFLATRTPQEGFDPYDIVVGADLAGGVRAGISMSFHIFQDPRDDYSIVPIGQVTGVDHQTPARDALSRQKALAANAHLQDKVSLKMENASLFQALHALSVKANIAFSAEYPYVNAKPAQRTFSLPEMSLGEMIDKISALYGGSDDQGKHYSYNWGQQGNPASQVFVFHISQQDPPAAE